MPFLKLPAKNTLPHVSLTPDQVIRLGTVSLAEARRMACRYPEFRQILQCHADIGLTDELKLVRGECLLLASTPFTSSHSSFDIYKKDVFLSAYVGVNCSRLRNAAQFLLDDGTPVFDMVMLFAANMRMQPTAELPGGVQVYFNQRVDETLNQTQDVKVLHDAGIAVLLSVLPSHDNAGWSCFDPSDARNVAAAEAFVEQLAQIVDAWDLDGIDIDNEYSTGTDYSASLTMVTGLLQEKMPGKIISGAWQPGDVDFFVQNPLTVYEPEPDPDPIFWRGGKLVDQLHYSWDMAYYDHHPANRMYSYNAIDIPLSRLAIGFSQEQNSTEEVVAYLTGPESRQQIGGVMIYELRRHSGAYVSAVTKALLGQQTHLDVTKMKTWFADGFPEAQGISEKCPPEGCQINIIGKTSMLAGQPADFFVGLTSDMPLEEVLVRFTFDAGSTGLVWPLEELKLINSRESGMKYIQLQPASASGVARVVASGPTCKPVFFDIHVYSHVLKLIGDNEQHIFTTAAPSPPLIVMVVDHRGISAGAGKKVNFYVSTVDPLLTLTQDEAVTDADGCVSVPVVAGHTTGNASVTISTEDAESITASLYIVLDRRLAFADGASKTITIGTGLSLAIHVEELGTGITHKWAHATEGIQVEFALEPGITGLTLVKQGGRTNRDGTATAEITAASAQGLATLTVSAFHAVSQTIIIRVLDQA